jgi:tRNA-dihydrouridine synthase
MVEHSKLFEELLPHKSFSIMKKHYKAYAKDFDRAAEFRARLMEANNASEVEQITNEFCVTV